MTPEPAPMAKQLVDAMKTPLEPQPSPEPATREPEHNPWWTAPVAIIMSVIVLILGLGIAAAFMNPMGH